VRLSIAWSVAKRSNRTSGLNISIAQKEKNRFVLTVGKLNMKDKEKIMNANNKSRCTTGVYSAVIMN